MKRIILTSLMCLFAAGTAFSQVDYDTYKAGQKDFKIALLGHSSLLFEYEDLVIYIDPWTNVTDFKGLPKADLILITHEHADHFDKKAINLISTENTDFIVSAAVEEELGYGEVMKNGDKTTFENFTIQAVPAYNIKHERSAGQPYHPKGRGNGYLITVNDFTVYVGGDTENIPEMDALSGKVTVAFLPKNLPYTMDDEMFIDAAKRIKPRFLYPYHYSEFDKEKIRSVLSEARIRLRFPEGK